MHVSRALLKNTRASLRFHKRFFIFLVALLIVIIASVAIASGLPGIITAGQANAGDGSGQGTTTQSTTFTDIPEATPTPTPDPSNQPTPTPTSTPPDPTLPPLTDTPEYSVGGALIALFVGFIAFTVYIKRSKGRQ